MSDINHVPSVVGMDEPRIESLPDEDDPRHWHINVRMSKEEAKKGDLFVSVAFEDEVYDSHYIDIVINEGRHVTVLSASSQ
jgi:hypothetical protein